jgi:hypothetical protein
MRQGLQKCIDAAASSSYRYKHKPVLRKAERKMLASFPVAACRF